MMSAEENIINFQERIDNKFNELFYIEGHTDGRAAGILFCLKRLSSYLQLTVGLKENEADAAAADILIPDTVRRDAGIWT